MLYYALIVSIGLLTPLVDFFHRVHTVTIDPPAMTLEVGDTAPAVCQPRNAVQILLKKTCDWSSSNTTLASVTPKAQTAHVVARKAGHLRVYATASGIRDTMPLQVVTSLSCVAASIDVLPADTTVAAVADTAQLNAPVLNTCQKPDSSIAVTWISQNALVATVQSTGIQRVRVTATGAGAVYIIAIAGTLRDSARVCVNGTSLSVAPASVLVTVSGTATVTGSPTNCTGPLGSAVTWISRAPGVATVVSAGTQTGTVTGVSAGSTYIVGSVGAATDSAAVTVTGSGASFAACDGLPTPLRTVPATPTTLSAALSGALAGDRIVLATGTYSAKTWSGRNGTVANPIALCGPKTAIFNGNLRPSNLDWWIFQGFKSQGAFQAIYAVNVDHSRFQGLTIEQVGQEAIHLTCGSVGNRIEADSIRNTGTSTPQWGEAVYNGSTPSQSSSNCGTSLDRSDSTVIVNNFFGPNVRSEDVDAKEGTRYGIVQGNVSNGAGKLAISANFESSIAIKGQSVGWRVIDNTLNPAAQNGSTSGKGIFVYSGALSAVVRADTINMTGASGVGLRIDASGTECSADNEVTNGTRSNVACNAP